MCIYFIIGLCLAINNKSCMSLYVLIIISSKAEQADGETEETFWDAMLNADIRDYERICSEFGVTDLYMVLKKLEEKKRERMQNKCKV